MAEPFDLGAFRAEQERLRKDHGGSDDGGMPPDLPERVAKLETHIEHMNLNIATLQTDVRDIRRDMNRDFRLTWGGLIVGGAALLGVLAKGFHWI